MTHTLAVRKVEQEVYNDLTVFDLQPKPAHLDKGLLPAEMLKVSKQQTTSGTKS